MLFKRFKEIIRKVIFMADREKFGRKRKEKKILLTLLTSSRAPDLGTLSLMPKLLSVVIRKLLVAQCD